MKFILIESNSTLIDYSITFNENREIVDTYKDEIIFNKNDFNNIVKGCFNIFSNNNINDILHYCNLIPKTTFEDKGPAYIISTGEFIYMDDFGGDEHTDIIRETIKRYIETNYSQQYKKLSRNPEIVWEYVDEINWELGKQGIEIEQFTQQFHLIRINSGSIDVDKRFYAVMYKNNVTSSQKQSLENAINWGINSKKKYFSAYCCNKTDEAEKLFDLSKYDAGTIVKECMKALTLGCFLESKNNESKKNLFSESMKIYQWKNDFNPSCDHKALLTYSLMDVKAYALNHQNTRICYYYDTGAYIIADESSSTLHDKIDYMATKEWNGITKLPRYKSSRFEIIQHKYNPEKDTKEYWYNTLDALMKEIIVYEDMLLCKEWYGQEGWEKLKNLFKDHKIITIFNYERID